MDLEKVFSDIPIGLAFDGGQFAFVHPDDNCAGYVDVKAYLVTPSGDDWWIEEAAVLLHGSSGFADGRPEESNLTGAIFDQAKKWLAEHMRDEIDAFVAEQWNDAVCERPYDKYRHEVAA